MTEVNTGTVTSNKQGFLWEIKNFSAIVTPTGTALNSPAFFTAYSDGKTLKWRLLFYPSSRENKDYISIYLHNLNKVGVTVKYKISIINDMHRDIFQRIYNPDVNIGTIAAMRTWGWPKFEKRASVMDEKNRTLLNDTLLVSCSIFSANSPLDGCDIDEDGVAASKYNKSLFENGIYSDITFSIEDQEMHLHKVIVASVSSVFEAMLQNDMKESRDNLVVIRDIKYDIVKEMFRYIYTRKVNNVDKIAGDLLIAAEKYAISGLKMMCEVSLCNTLNEENALHRLHLAVMYNTCYLKPKVVDYVAGKLKTFVGKAEFRELTHDCKDEILNALAKK